MSQSLVKGEVGQERGLWASCWGHREKSDWKQWEAGEKTSTGTAEGRDSGILLIGSGWMAQKLRWETKWRRPLYLANWGWIKMGVQKWRVTTRKLTLEERGKIKGKPARTVGRRVTVEASPTFRWAGVQRVFRRDVKIREDNGEWEREKGWTGTGFKEWSMVECSCNPRLRRLRRWADCKWQVNLGSRDAVSKNKK